MTTYHTFHQKLTAARLVKKIPTPVMAHGDPSHRKGQGRKLEDQGIGGIILLKRIVDKEGTKCGL